MGRRTTVILLAALVAASACGDDDGQPQSTAPPSEDGASLWVAPSTGDEIVRVGLDGTERATIELCCEPRVVAVGDDAVWVSTDGERVVRIDPASDEVVAEIEVGGSAGALTAQGNGAWVAVDGVELFHIDGATNEVHVRAEIGTTDAPIVGIEASEAGLWALRDFALELVRVDPGSGEVTARLPLCPTDECRIGAAATTGVADGTVWLVDDTALELLAIEPAGPSVRDRASLGEGLWNVAAGDEGVFLLDRDGGLLLRVDADDPVSRLAAPQPFDDPTALTVGEGSVWLFERGASDVVRIDPENLRTIDRFSSESLQWIAVG